MVDDDGAPSFIKFKPSPSATAPADVYQLALDFTAHVHRVVEQAERERYATKDRLDKLATQIAVLVGKAKEAPTSSARSSYYGNARKAAEDCRALLDMVHARSTLEPAVLQPARDTLAELLTRLGQLA